MTTGITVAEIQDRLATITRQIADVDRRGDHDVEVVAVTKGWGPETVRAAIGAGIGAIGENYAQELLGKVDVISELAPRVDFIGRLQSNKVRLLAPIVSVWSSIDRAGLIGELARRAPGARILVQVDTAGSTGKGGCPPGEVERLADGARSAGLVVDGLMTVGPTGATPEEARAGFRVVRALVDDLGLAVCSMGMSADMIVAVEEGSTQLRIGSALFGPRAPRVP